MIRSARAVVAAFAAAMSLVACAQPATVPAPDQPTLEAAPSPETGTEPGDQETLARTGRCGVERWSVKTGSDPDVGKISSAASPIPTTIAALSALPPPNPIPLNARVRPVETTVYYVHATLTGVKQEADQDYHLVLSDGAGHTMIAEIPSPACTPAGPLNAQIVAARRAFDTRYRPGRPIQLGEPVTLIGVGFFDFIHGQSGVARNGIELHPVLGIQFSR